MSSLESSKLEELLLKINENIVLLRKIQNIMVGAVADITQHNEDNKAHKKVIEEFQLGIDRKDMDKLNEEVSIMLIKIKALGAECNRLSERISSLENGNE